MPLTIDLSDRAQRVLDSMASNSGRTAEEHARRVLESVLGVGDEPSVASGVLRYDLLKIGLEHSRSLFEYHAGQRHAFHRYFFLVIALFVTAYTTILTRSPDTQEFRYVAIVICVAALALTLFFYRIDKRNETLVEIDEDLARQIEMEFAVKLDGMEEFKIFEKADGGSEVNKYKFLMPRLFLVFGILAALGLYYAGFCWRAGGMS